jgi:hypothetical protein
MILCWNEDPRGLAVCSALCSYRATQVRGLQCVSAMDCQVSCNNFALVTASFDRSLPNLVSVKF